MTEHDALAYSKYLQLNGFFDISEMFNCSNSIINRLSEAFYLKLGMINSLDIYNTFRNYSFQCYELDDLHLPDDTEYFNMAIFCSPFKDEQFFRTPYYTYSIEDMYWATRCLFTSDLSWCAFLNLTKYKRTYISDMLISWFEIFYYDDFTKESDFYTGDYCDNIIEIAVYIANLMAGTPKHFLKRYSTTGIGILSVAKYVNTIIDRVRKDLSNPPDDAFRTLLPKILPFCFIPKDDGENLETLYYTFCKGLGTYEKYSYKRNKYSDALDCAVKIIKNSWLLDQENYFFDDLFFSFTITEDYYDSIFANGFYKLAVEIFSTLFPLWKIEINKI